ncbi:hypothetical protein HELRODRAFT_174318 [Helobdella robusta]|uniref:Uncharacterized protein n=1 Tax=Helobdella robusta TaxID=6412 RepID=T1F7Z7_HELRO|nr:hypothetical protein HELRODRAFT_174318 [Helobdella robusta]ESO02876.1 hypothetical protein HELRODRAFT_174318 [Helobdella robusta]
MPYLVANKPKEVSAFGRNSVYMGSEKKTKEMGSELKTTEDFGLKLCAEGLQCNKDKLHQLVIKEKPGNLNLNLATNLASLNAELSTQTQVIISKLKSLEDAIGLQNSNFNEFRMKMDNFSYSSMKILEEKEKVAKTRVEQNEQKIKKYSDAVKGKVDKLSLDVKQRRNNVILYNLQEKGVKTKEVVKNLLKEISEIDLETEGIEISRLGRKMEDDQKSRPVLIQFANINTKNLLLANCYKLKKSAIFNKVIVNHDLSKEERSNNRKL